MVILTDLQILEEGKAFELGEFPRSIILSLPLPPPFLVAVCRRRNVLAWWARSPRAMAMAAATVKMSNGLSFPFSSLLAFLVGPMLETECPSARPT